MKKIILIYLMISLWGYGYDYPHKDPYLATVLATPTKDMAEFKDTNFKEIRLDLKGDSAPPNLWYLDGFRFGLMAQDHEAPLTFLLAGTGSKYNSYKMLTMSRILYQNGFSVIMLPTSFDYNFIISASKTHAPGFLKRDSNEIYDIMKLALDKVKEKIQYKETYVTGFSLGGTTALVVGEIDSRKKHFDFKRIAAVNPTVNLYESAKILDDMLDDNIKSEEELDQLLQKIILGIMKYGQVNGSTKIDEAAIYSLFKHLNMEEKELKILIGAAFRFIAIDVNYISDVMTKSGVYTDPNKKITKFQSMSEYYSAINYSNFQNYIERIGFKTYKKLDKTLTMEKMIENSSLKTIENYLKEAENIGVFTNEDELILTPDNLKYLKETMGSRIKIYPHGGHCGNMFYEDNIASMVHYLKRGELR
ncbi:MULTISPECIES: serine/threonine protein kinase [Psychrilyobacter]|uniref:Serine/threonine protein kinase n=1 Tax=Psychrilyobacter piezotolerans TaxID=2293438 RepID=A0ABX9KF51_9FUSO|nr:MULTISPECIES: serine/threonine protein kinase [Psychrilyobacter]MCS5421565.1 serine/threonine protein kinase [Psychrilyobacter sp. S5]NDI78591.1 serine/threonine protein kinase [Psychrilyobacter piezotolerans]RDE60294.1 serine/threonine protein kinase [Psychrilyobacter sp. S5]REI40402.1 serine/threonine protein kinase [Psychrilyobacter piezotolerans]